MINKSNCFPLMTPGRSKSAPGLYPNQMYGIMWSVCGYCGEELDAQLTSPKKDGELSHGCCKPCFRKMMGYDYVPVLLLIPYCLIEILKVVSLA